MSTRRITVEEVLEAYRVTGLKPKAGWYCTDDGTCACAIGAIAIAAGIERNADAACEWADDHFSPKYHGGFTSGFDGRKLPRVADEAAILGHQDGMAVRAAVFQKQGAN